MKKFLTLLLCFYILILQSFAVIVEDEFVDETLDKNLKIKNNKYSPIADDFAQNNKNKNSHKRLVVIDEVLPETSKQVLIKKPNVIGENYNEIKVRSKEEYSTKNMIEEGEFIDFITVEDVKIKNKDYPKGTVIKARIETVSQNKIWGVPADLVVGNFMLDDNKLMGEISKTGANRSLWLYPAVGAGCCFLGAGLLLIPIRGGHAKIKPSQVYTLYTQER